MAKASSGERLQRLYARLERLRVAEVRVAAAAVEEAESLNTLERGTWCTAAEVSRAALAEGLAGPWLAAETLRALSLVRSGQLVALQKTRQVLHRQAQATHLASRLQAEQMRQIVWEQERQTRAAEARRMQAETDDRFLARREWLRTRTGTVGPKV